MADTGTFSARFGMGLLERLDARARRLRQSRSRLAERYIDEGMRIDDHPGIVFRDGPAGRRPAVAAGPDVWEVIGVLKGVAATGDAAVTQTADHLGLTRTQVRTAVRYYADYPDEIDEWIAVNDEEAAAAEAAWHRERAALG
jgi:hypothetical protein